MNIFSKLATHDNFWNCALYIAVGIAAQISSETDSALLFLLAITFVPYIMTRFNKVQYLESRTFINARGEDLSNRLPTKLPIVLLVTIIVCGLTMFDLPTIISERFVACFLVLFITFIPFSYFVFINCPISILCNKHAYQQNVTGIVPVDAPQSKLPTSTSYRNASWNDPSYRNVPGNIYYDHSNKR